MNEQIIIKTAEFSRLYMQQFDASHDYQHVHRVAKSTSLIVENDFETKCSSVQKMITKEETLFMALMSAYLHDMNDHKYGKNENIEHFLKKQSISNDHIAMILYVVDNVSFSKEKKKGTPKFLENEKETHEKNIIASFILSVVRDADRLDAIGSIGIARTFIYSFNTKSPIYTENIPFSSNKDTTIAHFYEKLLLLKEGIKNPYAKKLAENRHAMMVLFLNQLQQEVL